MSEGFHFFSDGSIRAEFTELSDMRDPIGDEALITPFWRICREYGIESKSFNTKEEIREYQKKWRRNHPLTREQKAKRAVYARTWYKKFREAMTQEETDKYLKHQRETYQAKTLENRLEALNLYESSQTWTSPHHKT